MKLQKKSIIVEQALKRLLEEMSEGEQLPSVRSLMGKFGVSQMVVDQALESLENSGWIYRRGRKGIFRYGIGNKKNSRLAVLCRDWGSAVYREIDVKLRKLCMENEIFVEKFLFPLSQESLFRYVPIQEFDIVLIIDPLPLQPQDIVRICNLPIPVLFLGRRFENTTLNYISTIPMENGIVSAGYLWKQGCRKTAVLYGESKDVEHSARYRGFDMIARLYNIEVEILDARTTPNDDACQNTYDFLQKYFSEHSQIDFDSIYLLGDSFYPAVLKILNSYHIRVPADVSVLGSDGNDVGLFCSVPLSTVGVPYSDYVSKTFEAIMRLLHNRKELIQIDLQPFVIERSSVINTNRKGG